ncbi:PH domain-containing protein [Rhizosphaericola mali]|uniref:Bacterial Pleckstrin homology domain-containing protein n=1 Tax=Rhizosphaericola mali TaxID=2545455 RepID=A0A5P2G7A0_9BACT|nr:PH domain-containing protein [Rhizosphaericola mali]QES87391.1 hypothetical protein E0W69_001515 [Rhizosphaericola mali]
MVFKTSMSKSVKIITISISIVFILQIGYSIFFKDKYSGLISIFLISTYFYSFLSKPKNYELTKTDIIIRRFIFTKIIDREEVEKVELLDADRVKGIYRIFGNGGLWGYVGTFSSRRLGIFQAYMTGFHNLILIQLKNDKKIVISPYDTREFINQYYHF